MSKSELIKNLELLSPEELDEVSARVSELQQAWSKHALVRRQILIEREVASYAPTQDDNSRWSSIQARLIERLGK